MSIMFRHGLRRCTQQAGIGAVAPMLRFQTMLPTARQALVSPSRLISPLKTAPVHLRAYSAEPAVQQEPVPIQEDSDAFDALRGKVHGSLLKGITKDMGYERMTPVQAKTIHPALKGTDIVAQAKTGTGKTLAFLLPLFQRMIEEDKTLASWDAKRRARCDDIRGIVLSPTRELAEQIAAEARQLARNTGLVVQSAVGGTHKASSLRQMQRQGCHLLVGTPGRLNDLLHDPHSGIGAPNLAALVLDEADRMLDVGFERELNEIISALPDVSEKQRQTMLVSATIPDSVIRLARSMVRQDDFEFVQTIGQDEALTHDKIPQHMVPVSSWHNMFPTLFELVSREIAKAEADPSLPPFKAIVYLNTSAAVELVANIAHRLRVDRTLPIPVHHIQGRRTQAQRTQASDAFRRAKSAILISSDVTARGMDFPNVTHVIQVDVPTNRETYIHRLGRTGRQDKGGQGWLLLPPLSVSNARRDLRGLPIQKNETLQCAAADVQANELPMQHKLKEIYSQTDRFLLNDAYITLLSVAALGRRELVQDLNQWVEHGWQWSQAPPVSESWARKHNLLGAPLNVESSRDTRGRPSRFGNRGTSDRPRNAPSDPFSNMRQSIRRDDGRPSRYRSEW